MPVVSEQAAKDETLPPSSGELTDDASQFEKPSRSKRLAEQGYVIGGPQARLYRLLHNALWPLAGVGISLLAWQFIQN